MKDDLVGYLLDALSAEEEAQVERRLEQDPGLAKELDRLRRVMVPLADDDCIEPPDGLANRTLEFVREASLPAAAARREWNHESRALMRPVDFAVAAGLLCIAAMLVLPAIATIRGDHGRVLCADQLRQVGVSLAMYADNENGQFPYVDSDGPMSYAGVFTVSLQAKDLLTDERQFVCPSAKSALVHIPRSLEEYLSTLQNPSRALYQRRHLSGSYGYSLGFHENGRHRGATLSGLHPLISDRPPRDHEIAYVNSPNHDGKGQNVLYGGGNVRWLPSRIYGRDDLFRNSDCQIGAGIGASDAVIGVSEASPYPSPTY